jgi:hypothetical protein
MADFPRTAIGGVSVSRMVIGTNWFLGFTHNGQAKDRFIRELQTGERLVEILCTFLASGVDIVMLPPNQFMVDAIHSAEQRAGRKMFMAITPAFNIVPGGPAEAESERVFDTVADMGATFCLPHQCVTDALIDKRAGIIRDIDLYTRQIRERGLIPGLSTHMPETTVYADKQNADVETYIQIYNAAGFLMQMEADWVMRVIRDAQRPVMTIKPLAAGHLLPSVGLAFVWNAIRPQDLVTVGVTTPGEAQEVIEISLALLQHELPRNELQSTRSKRSLMEVIDHEVDSKATCGERALTRAIPANRTAMSKQQSVANHGVVTAP